MEWDDWIMIALMGCIMIIVLYHACHLLNWMMGMMTAIKALRGGF